MIVIEGPDGAGKSTLVEHFEKAMGVTREPRAVSSDAESLVPIGDYIITELGKGYGNRVYDRFALVSSPIYSMLPNPTFTAPMTDLEWLTEQWNQFYYLRPQVVVCLPPFDVAWNNVKDDPKNQVVLDHFFSIYSLYQNFIATARHPMSLWVWDYTAPTADPDYFTRRVLRFHEDRMDWIKNHV